MRSERIRQRAAERKKRRREERRHALRELGAQKDAGTPRDLDSLPEPAGDDHGRIFTSRVPAGPLPADVEAWPIVRAYAPVKNVWETTGCGTAGVVRQQPDGRYASAFFVIELLGHGLWGAFGGKDETLAKVDEDFARLGDNFPLCEEGPVELAASFAWGARAFSDAEGYSFPQRDLDRFYGLMPQPAGSQRSWVEKLVGAGGLTPEGLVRVIRANPQPDDLPDGKEIVILTEMTFGIPDPDRALAAVQRASPEFEPEGVDGEAEVFTWTRPYPKSHWSPLSALGGRQILGSVRVTDRELVADAKTLSMAAVLVGKLHRMLGGELRLKESRWKGMQELLAQKKVDATGS
ncbi:MAG TPA: hypothetical protein VFG53_21170 [Anaeromyxobacter sp.]|nr:hypothetical protein [Anaeromyxobacter sp.]